MVSAFAQVDTGPMNLRYYETLGDMLVAANPKANNRVVMTLGYSYAGDGQGATYYATNTVSGTNTTTLIYSGTSGWSWMRIGSTPLAPSVLRISYEGDSIVNQTEVTWPDYIATYSPYFSRASYVTNYGTAGNRVSAMNGQYATEAHLNRPQNDFEEAWFFMHGGGNDLADGVGSANVYQYLKNEWEAARLDGYKVVAFEVTPRYDFSAYSPAIETERQTLNALIRSDPTLYDYLVPASIMPSAASTNIYYYDGTHPTDVGARTLARMAIDVIFGKAYEITPQSITGVTNTINGLILLPTDPMGTVAIGTTNTTAKLTVATSYADPTGGLDTNTAMVVANNNVVSGTANLSILSRSSGLSRLYFGNDALERNDYIEADFSGAGLGLAFGIFGSEKMHLDTTGLGIGTNTPNNPLEVVGSSPQYRLTHGSDISKYATWGVNSSGYVVVVPSGGSFQVTGNGQFSNYVLVGSGSPLIMGTNAVLYSLTTNSFSMFDASQTLAADLGFGPATTSNVRLVPTGTNLDLKLGDRSFFTQFRPGYIAPQYSGGSGHFLKQTSLGGTVTSGVLTTGDMPSGVPTSTAVGVTNVSGVLSANLVAGSNITFTTNAGGSVTITGTTTSLADGDKGDITVSGSGGTWTIDNGVVTLAKMSTRTASTLIGRGQGSGDGAPQELTLGAGLSLTGTVLSVSGGTDGETNTASNLGTGTGLYYQKSGVDLQFNSIAAGTGGITLSSNANTITISNVETNTTTIALSDTVNAITTGTEKQSWFAPYAFTIKSLKLTVGTQSSSGIVRVNIKEAGTTILSTRISIDALEDTSATAATAYVLSDTSIASNAKLTFDIDDAGTGAKNLQLTIYHTKN